MENEKFPEEIMKTIHTALFTGVSALLFAGCALFAPAEPLPATAAPAPAPAPAAKPAEPAAKPAPAPAAEPAAKPLAAGVDEQAVRFAGPERNPVVLLCGCFGAKENAADCAVPAGRLVAAGYVDADRPLPEGRAYANLFRFHCDPKLDIPGNAAKLHEFLTGLRARLQKEIETNFKRPGYDVRFDLVAPGACGQLARYYLRFGEQQLPANGISLPLLDWRGAKLADKVILIAPPCDGTLEMLTGLVDGRISCPAAFQLLPGANAGTVRYADAPAGPALDLFDPAVWRANRWKAPDSIDTLLRRARQFRSAMEIPSQPPKNVALFLFAGNSVPTASLLLVDRATGRLSVAGSAPGDGRTTVASARFDRRGAEAKLPFSQSPVLWQSVTHLPGKFSEILASDRLWDDVRYDLLMFPTDRQREQFHLNRK